MRDEALSLCEWMAHYKAIGAEWFFIYTNNNADGTDRLLKWFSGWAPVTAVFDSAALGVNTQFKAYEHALTLMPEIRLFDWLLVVDADEFLVPSSQHDFHLARQLQDTPANTDAVVFPWLWRCWEPHFKYGGGLLSARFPYASGSNQMKAAARLPNAVSLLDLHRPRLTPPGVFRDAEMNVIPSDELKSSTRTLPYTAGWVDHYWGRSFEEYCIKKARGDTMNLSSGHWKRDFSQYFSWSGSMRSEHLWPQPRILQERVAQELARIQGQPGFAEVWRGTEAHYAALFSSLRANQELRQVFDQFMAQRAAAR
jgi:hypothetical protein